MATTRTAKGSETSQLLSKSLEEVVYPNLSREVAEIGRRLRDDPMARIRILLNPPSDRWFEAEMADSLVLGCCMAERGAASRKALDSLIRIAARCCSDGLDEAQATRLLKRMDSLVRQVGGQSSNERAREIMTWAALRIFVRSADWSEQIQERLRRICFSPDSPGVADKKMPKPVMPAAEPAPARLLKRH